MAIMFSEQSDKKKNLFLKLRKKKSLHMVHLVAVMKLSIIAHELHQSSSSIVDIQMTFSKHFKNDRSSF